MADQSAIDLVKLQLPDEAVEFGLTDDIIGTMLDSGASQTKVTLHAWRAISAKASTIEDVNESGSSRTTNIANIALQQVAYWQTRSDLEDKVPIVDATGRQRFASHKATRV